jgi:hypothetical protein
VNGWKRFWGRRLGKQLIIIGLLAVSSLTGCASLTQDPSLYTGAGLGAALGAGLGAAINNGNPWRGALIGGLLGAAGGGVAGEVYGRTQPQANAQPQQQGSYQPSEQGYYQPPQQGNYQPAPYYGPPPS